MAAIKIFQGNLRFLILFSLILILNNCFAQINDTPLDRYVWGKKRTEMEDGYIILRNGKRLDGKIQLAGRPDAINKIIFIKDEKELELDPANIKAYGLNVSLLVNESPDEMYGWRTGGTALVNGVERTPSSTKNMKGYIVLLNGKRKEGILHLNAVNGQLTEFVIRTEEEGKLIFKPAEVSRYGLNPLIRDISKGGARVFDEEAKNFRNGYCLKADGTKLTGIVAFMKAEETRTNDVYFYQSLFYTTGPEVPLTVIGSTDLLKVVQLKGDTEVVYVPFNGGFVPESQLSALAIEDQYKLFQPGRIILPDNIELKGEVAQIIAKGQAFTANINFKDADGHTKEYNINSIKFFEQTISKKTYAFISYANRFVYLMFDGETMAFFKNPFPTTVNETATTAARIGASIGGSAASGALVNSTKGTSEKEKEELRKNIYESSSEQNRANSEKIGELREDVNSSNLDKDIKKDIAKETAKVQLAIEMEEAGRAVSESLVIYNVEYFVWNKKSSEKTLIIKKDFADTMEPVLKSCDKYLALVKEEQKKCRKLDNIVSTMKMVDECQKK